MSKNRKHNFSEYYQSNIIKLCDTEKNLTKIFIQQMTEYTNHIKNNLTVKGNQPKTRTQFLFDFLRDDDIPTGRKALNSNHMKLMHKRTVVYNRQLKRLQKELGISVNITSHLARTAFTNIALSRGVSTSDLMGILGHSSLATTNAYISVGFSSQTKDDALTQIGQL